MSIDHRLRDAVRAALLAAPAFAAAINRIGDGEGEDAPVPAAWLGDSVASDWGAKDRPGREVRLALTIADRGDGARLAALAAAAETAVAGIPRGLGAWETGGAVVTALRFRRRRDGLRLALIDIRLRAWRVGD